MLLYIWYWCYPWSELRVDVSSQVSNSWVPIYCFVVDSDCIFMHFESGCLLPKYINSVLESISFYLMASIHALASSNEYLMIAMWSCSWLVPDLNCFHMEWSSSNLLNLRSSLMTSWIVEAYVMEMKAPWTHPWGTLKFVFFFLWIWSIYGNLKFSWN